jgi:hypothetical protein
VDRPPGPGPIVFMPEYPRPRELFAALLLQGMLSGRTNGVYNAQGLVNDSVEIADMLVERLKATSKEDSL